MAYSPPVRRTHRGRRLLIGILVLVGLLIAADRIALVVSERAAADTIQNSQALSRRPSVSVAGFPFLTQLAAGDLRTVTISDHDVTAGTGSRALTLAAVTVVLHHVDIARDLSSVKARSATATARADYAALSQALGLTLDFAGTSGGVGRVRAQASVTVLGQTVSGTVTAGVRVSGDSLQFVDPTVDGTQVPSAAVPLLQQVFGAPLSLAGLPFGVHLDGVSATAGGLSIALSGANLSYVRS